MVFPIVLIIKEAVVVVIVWMPNLKAVIVSLTKLWNVTSDERGPSLSSSTRTQIFFIV